jgi:hypothetical protein
MWESRPLAKLDQQSAEWADKTLFSDLATNQFSLFPARMENAEQFGARELEISSLLYVA